MLVNVHSQCQGVGSPFGSLLGTAALEVGRPDSLSEGFGRTTNLWVLEYFSCRIVRITGNFYEQCCCSWLWLWRVRTSEIRIDA